MNPARVLVVGSVNQDTVIECAKLPAPGETIFAARARLLGGGKGANQAVASARLGAPTVLLARVGRDDAGRDAVAELEAEGVHVQHVLIDAHHPTGRAVVLVDAAGENSIVVVPGANSELRAADVEHFLTEVAVHAPDVVLISAETPDECAEVAGRICADVGARALFNVAPFRPLAPWVTAHKVGLVVNQVEAEQATGCADPIEAAMVLAAPGGLAVVTMGARGAVVADAGQPVTVIPAPSVIPVDSTGAGDAFCGALAASLSATGDVMSAVRLAVAAGAHAVLGVGARASLARPADVDEVHIQTPVRFER